MNVHSVLPALINSDWLAARCGALALPLLNDLLHPSDDDLVATPPDGRRWLPASPFSADPEVGLRGVDDDSAAVALHRIIIPPADVDCEPLLSSPVALRCAQFDSAPDSFTVTSPVSLVSSNAESTPTMTNAPAPPAALPAYETSSRTVASRKRARSQALISLDGEPAARSTPARARRRGGCGSTLPSRFCHMCARTQKSRKVVCGNIASGACRKAVCELCFVEHGWDFGHAEAEQSAWCCPHCRGLCNTVPRARCHIYNKTNERRKSARKRADA